MPVPTSPVRPVPTTLQRVRTRLPSLLPIGALLLALGWAAFTAEGNAAAAPWVARALAGAPADCAHPWGAWAALLRGELGPAALDGCLPAVVGEGPRRAALIRLATVAGGDPAARERAARVLLRDPGQAEAVVEDLVLAPGRRGARRGALLTSESLAWAALDLGAFAERAPLGGLYDRALLLRNPDAAEGRALDALAADLRPVERAWLAALPAAAVPSVPPPAPEGVLALVPERGRDHVADEWAALVRFVRDGPARAALPDAETRWLWVAEAESPGGPPATSVHAVLRGEAAAPALAAWVLQELAAAAGLTADLTRGAEHLELHVGRTTVRLGRCGSRVAAPARGADVAVAPDDARAAAVDVVLAAHLRAGERGEAEALGERAGPVAPTLAAWAQLLDGHPLVLAGAAPRVAPAPVALRPPPRARGRRAAAPPPAPEPVPLAAPADARARALLAWWAAPTHPELARELARQPTAGAAEGVRRAALGRLGEPGAVERAPPGRGCEDPALPWPPDPA